MNDNNKENVFVTAELIRCEKSLGALLTSLVILQAYILFYETKAEQDNS